MLYPNHFQNTSSIFGLCLVFAGLPGLFGIFGPFRHDTQRKKLLNLRKMEKTNNNRLLGRLELKSLGCQRRKKISVMSNDRWWTSDMVNGVRLAFAIFDLLLSSGCVQSWKVLFVVAFDAVQMVWPKYRRFWCLNGWIFDGMRCGLKDCWC